eukprot:6007984-Pyramimonas_sp.AAC.1
MPLRRTLCRAQSCALLPAHAEDCLQPVRFFLNCPCSLVPWSGHARPVSGILQPMCRPGTPLLIKIS